MSNKQPGKWKRVAPLLLGVAGAVVIVALKLPAIVPMASMTNRVPIARTTRPRRIDDTHNRSGLTCSGGADYPADIELVPDAVVTTAGRQAVDYHAEINVHRGKAVGIAWQADVVDDRGNQVVTDLAKNSVKAKAGDTAITSSILPQQLADGYYQVRVRAAVSVDDEAPTVLEAAQPVRISDGKWLEMDADKWRSASNATLANAGNKLPVKGVQ